MDIFINELIGALSQLLLFSIIPVLVWLIVGRKKENLFEYLGLKKVKGLSSGLKTLLLTLLVCACYVGCSSLAINFFASDSNQQSYTFVCSVVCPADRQRTLMYFQR